MGRRYVPGRHVEFPPKDETERVADHLEWLLYLPQLDSILPKPVNARYLVKALMDVSRVNFHPESHYSEVRLSWQILLDVMGPRLFREFLNMGARRDFAPRTSAKRSTANRQLLWTDGTDEVWVQMKYDKDEACDLAIVAERAPKKGGSDD